MGGLPTELRGALAGILSLAYSGPNAKNHLRVDAGGSVSVLIEQVKMVAGARFEPDDETATAVNLQLKLRN